MTRHIITLKWGTRYGPEFINRLASSARRHSKQPISVVCFTDDATGIDPSVTVHPIPDIELPEKWFTTPWRKLCLFRDDLPIEGVALFLDLDIVITGPLDQFFEFGELGQVPIIHNWVAPHKKWFRPDPLIGNSSVFRFHLNHCRYVWDQFHSEKEYALANFRPPQSYLTHCIRKHMVFWPDHWVKSFKRHSRPKFPLNYFLEPKMPENASIIAFHGLPDPNEALVGFKGTKPHHHTRPAPWIAEHWR